MTEALFVYITVPSADVARAIARAVLEERLAACANILPAMSSLYIWQEKLEEAEEFVLIVKTSAHRFEKLSEKIRSLHPYECPCIVGVPISVGSTDYLDWINACVNVEG